LSEFEFVQVTVAIILGLGITELLRNIGEQIRRRSSIEVYSLQVAASCVLVLVILRYLWTFWSNLEVFWNLPLFLLTVSPSIALALSAQVIKVDCDSDASPKEQYFKNSIAIYLFWATAPLCQLIFDVVLDYTFTSDYVVRLLVVGLLASVGFIKKPAYHWIVLSGLFIGLIVGMFQAQFTLTTPGG
jgi:hypothetical protein